MAGGFGELLAEMEMWHGARDGKTESHCVTSLKTLKDIGLNKIQSSRWQQLASIPPDRFELFCRGPVPISMWWSRRATQPQTFSEYARQANDTTLLDLVSTLRIGAERKVGELLAEIEMNKGELKHSSRSHDGAAIKTLKDIGINKNQSSRWQFSNFLPPVPLFIVRSGYCSLKEVQL